MANKDKATSKYSEYYSHLLLDNTKRAGFIIVFLVVFVAMTYVITANVIEERSWVVSSVPVTLIGIPMMFYPAVERWAYKPWQAKARKYERHYRD